jgi:branched-chain amino acid transport system ATP-binding protein
MLLEVKDINVHYQKVQAVTDISIQIDDGQIVTLIGATTARAKAPRFAPYPG